MGGGLGRGAVVGASPNPYKEGKGGGGLIGGAYLSAMAGKVQRSG